ncbi:MAG: ABC transporter ATP-binding protein [Vulcanimicrobiaceae bacterium]
MGALQAHEVNKAFGLRPALNQISLRVQNAERFVLLGPSASGKTTLLRVLAGLLSADSGAITMAGVDVTRRGAQSRKVGMVFQEGALYPHLSVFDNLAFPLRIARVADREVRARVRAAGALFEIEPLFMRSARVLSAGERQRVAIARALLAEPHVLLLDEPFAHLDGRSRRPVRDSLLSAALDARLAMMFVTHDHDEALAIADRLAILIDGRIVQCDSPARVYEFPATTAVAQFLGPFPMNLFEDETQRFGMGRVTIGIRPSDIIISDGPADVEGVVRTCEFAGSGWLAVVQTPLGSFSILDPARKSAIGERVRLGFAREKMRRFDPFSGGAIA